jgi:hypothetical protein
MLKMGIIEVAPEQDGFIYPLKAILNMKLRRNLLNLRNFIYEDYNCEGKLHGQQAQSLPSSGSTTIPIESSSCPYSEDTTQQLSQEPIKQE